MKKNYFLTLVVTLLMAVTASAADNLAGIYKLTNLTGEQTEALGTVSADAAIRILPGDEAADYYLSGIAGYGCKFAATYDATAGTLTAVDQSPYGEAFGIMLLHFSDMGLKYVDATSIEFKVKDDGTMELNSEIIVADLYSEEVYGTYVPGIALAKDETPAIPAADIAGYYTFTGNGINYATYEDETVEYTMSIEQADGNTLTINGFMGIDGIQATYIPEVGMIEIASQEVGETIVMQNNGDIYFVVSGNELELTTPATALAANGMPIAAVIEGKAVKGSSTGIGEVAPQTISVYVRNGAIYVNSAEPVAVQVYNAAGVQVYADNAVNGPITLPRGIYFVKVAGNTKAVSVAL